ncbi:response regulator [Candidatus Aerophobetes bacterium]|nr:response regulator [Candidatus Aerophobetes bacterium]
MYELLVVENEESLRKLYQEELEEEGYGVVCVSSAKEALDKIREGHFHLVVLDIKMPGMDGLELLGKMLGEERKIPVIINSAYPRYKSDFMSWAAEAFIVKSSNLGELKDTIKKVLTKYYPDENKV